MLTISGQIEDNSEVQDFREGRATSQEIKPIRKDLAEEGAFEIGLDGGRDWAAGCHKEGHSRNREQHKKNLDREWWRGKGPGIREENRRNQLRKDPKGPCTPV